MSGNKLKYTMEAEDGVTPKVKRVNKSFQESAKISTMAGAKMVALGNMASQAMMKIGSMAIDAVKKTMQEADSFRKLGESVGLTASEVAGLDRAYNLSGAGAEGLKMTLNGLTRALDPSKVTEQQKAVQELGVSVRNSDGSMKSHQQLLLDISEAYKNETDVTKKASIGVKLFGDQANKIAVVLNQGSEELAKQQKLYGDASNYSQDYARSMETLNDAIYKGQVGFQGLMVALTDSELFSSAVNQISRLSDAWIKLSADMKNVRKAEENKKIAESTEKLSKRFDDLYSRIAKGLPVEHTTRKVEELRLEAEIAGQKLSVMYATEAAAINNAIKAGKEQGASVENLTRLQDALNYAITRKNYELKNEKNIQEGAEKAEREKAKALKASEEAYKKVTTASIQAQKAGERREFTFISARDLEMQAIEAEKIHKQALSDSLEAEREYNDALAEIRMSNMEWDQREREEARLWYEEKRAIVGNNAELQLQYEERLRAVNEKKHQEELDHLKEVQEAEMNRLETQDMVVQSTFEFLKTATDGYKSLGKVAKAVALAEAWWNTYVSFTKALSQYGPIAGPVLGSIALAQGAVMTSKISAKKYREGGLVDDVREYGDQNYARMNGGELVIPKKEQASLWNFIKSSANTVRGLSKNSGSHSDINVNINGMYMDSSAIRRLQGALNTVKSRQ